LNKETDEQVKQLNKETAADAVALTAGRVSEKQQSASRAPHP
jgi:hypothetical protein